MLSEFYQVHINDFLSGIRDSVHAQEDFTNLFRREGNKVFVWCHPKVLTSPKNLEIINYILGKFGKRYLVKGIDGVFKPITDMPSLDPQLTFGLED